MPETLVRSIGPFIFFILHLKGFVSPSSLTLTSSPTVATEGVQFLLSCSKSTPGSFEVDWIKDGQLFLQNVNKFETVVANVSPSPSQHILSFRVNSTVDGGSVWRCRSGEQLSNSIRVLVFSTRTESIPTSNQSTASLTIKESASSAVPIVAAVVSVAGVFFSVALVFFICNKTERKTVKQDIVTTEKNVHDNAPQGQDTASMNTVSRYGSYDFLSSEFTTRKSDHDYY